MIEIVKYSAEYKLHWNELLNRSKNGTFLINRDYMDYHSDRFTDCSFMFFKKGKPEAILPGNISNNVFHSHQGLTYGGLILSEKLALQDVVEIFGLLNQQLLNSGINEVIYKPIPYIYHTQPSQEDIYALYKLNASKIGCNISSTIYQEKKIKFIESRKSGIRKGRREGVVIEESERFDLFWEILDNNLQNKYQVNAVHTLEEIMLLKSRFSDNIKLYTAVHNNLVIGGTVVYLMDDCIHVQYISASEIGKELGALDLLFDELINQVYTMVPIFDFGQSTEKMGQVLNESLIFQKEGFGGRGVAYDIYKYALA